MCNHALNLIRATLVLLGLVQYSLVQAQEMHDPMQPPAYALQKYREAQIKQAGTGPVKVVKKIPVKTFQLSSILYSAQRKIAIIDDQAMAVGDTINGARLVSITRNRARLINKGKRIDLILSDELTDIKKSVVERNL